MKLPRQVGETDVNHIIVKPFELPRQRSAKGIHPNRKKHICKMYEWCDVFGKFWVMFWD
jgi:hypothetical protein